jgi:hypothetical protein
VRPTRPEPSSASVIKKIKILDIVSDLFINTVILYIWKYIIRTVCPLRVVATHVAIIREARYEGWIYRDIKKVSELMHRCKTLSIKNRWFKIRMFRSILIIFRELLNVIKTYMNFKLMHGHELNKEMYCVFIVYFHTRRCICWFELPYVIAECTIMSRFKNSCYIFCHVC